MGTRAIIRRKEVWLVAGAHWGLVWHLPRLLRSPTVRLTLLAPESQPFRHSRFVDQWIPLPLAAAPAAAELVEQMRRGRPDVLLHAAQDIVEALAVHPPDIDWLPGAAPDLIPALRSKCAAQQWGEHRGIPAPPGAVCRGPEDAAAWVAAHGRSILKKDGVHGGFGVEVVPSPAEAARAWVALGKPTPFLVQSFVTGPVGVTELVLRRGEPTAWFSSFKERTSRPLGASVMRRMVKPDGMPDLIERVQKATGALHGLFGFDWVLDEKSGRVLLLEFHPRAPSGYGCGFAAGVDIPSALSDMIEDRPGPMRSPPAADILARSPLCCYFPAHLVHALRHRPSDLRYWLPGTHAVSWANVPWDDPRPLAGVLRAALRRAWVERIKKLASKTGH